jgi:peptide-methionine (S)-S-oxide reductase
MKTDDLMEAAFGAGCFWGVEHAFSKTRGVMETEVGYMGGSLSRPTYEEVSSGRTGHAETVHLRYDPDQVSYEDLLEVFWSNHDPTQKDRQGADIGHQYRSVIFYYDEEQKAKASESMRLRQESGRFRKGIVTEIAPATTFWRAEDYHQKYFERRGKG